MTRGIIVAEPELFDPAHLPHRLKGRESQVEELLRCLAPSACGQRPMHVWVHGRTGTGKTSAVRSALAKHSACCRVPCVYVNCLRARTAYAVLDSILTDLRILLAETPQVLYKARRLAEALAGRPLVVALDEIDRQEEGERHSILHILTEMAGVGLVCVSESQETMLALQPSILNRLSPVIVEMHPYDTGLLSEILADRCESGLVSGTWCAQLVQRVAAMASGDARVAIQTLRSAAYTADCEATGFIRDEHIRAGFEKAQAIRRGYLLRKLTAHHRILYEIVLAKKKVTLGHLSQAYRERCAAEILQPVSQRSLLRYTDALKRLRLVRGEKARVFGNVTTLEAVE